MLKNAHLALGAKYSQYFGVEAVAEYTAGADAEYAAAHEAAVLVDRSWIGRIVVGGADRIDFLQRMTTNEMRNLAPGSGAQTVLTTAEGRVVDLLAVLVRPDSLLVLASPPNRRKVLDWFRRNIFFRDKVKPVDVGDAASLFTVIGPRAAPVLTSLVAGPFPQIAEWQSASASIGGADVLLIADASWPDAFDLLVPADKSEQVWSALLVAGAPHGLKPAGTLALEMMRIERGVPAAGAELGEDVNPLEAGLRPAVSFSKGCYTGQEVIARTENYQKLKQVLVRLSVDVAGFIELPAPLTDGTEVGRLTSLARVPGHTGALGLGYVRTKYAKQGAQFGIGAGALHGTARITGWAGSNGEAAV